MMSASEGEGVMEKQTYKVRLCEFCRINQFQMPTWGGARQSKNPNFLWTS